MVSLIDTAGRWSPLLAVLLPLVGAPAVYYAFKKGNHLRGLIAVVVSLTPLLSLITAAPLILAGEHAVLPAPGIPDLDPHFRMDGLSYVFALLAAAVWPIITAYSLSQGYPRTGQPRFFATSMITFGATVGLFVAGDLLTFFLLFEMMTFTAYALLVHRRNRLTMQLSGIYLYMGVAGGLALFFAFMLLIRATGTAAIVPAVDQLAQAGTSPLLVAVFLLIGFGAKAGMVGLHIWLPSTYTRAPFPVTAMFSAVMSKAGIYGLLRFVTLVLVWPEPGHSQALTIAWIILWPGLLTMIAGAAMALKAHSVKRLLAFSSMSQMGYMLVGIGSLMALGSAGSLAASGTVMHSINHALFKTVLFLVAGTLALRAGGYSWNHLLGRLRGWHLIPVIIASLGVMGIPGISGFVSKTLIHEGLEEAYYTYRMGHLHLAEYAFSLGSGLTGAYYIKLLLALIAPRWAGWMEHEAENARREGIPDYFDPPPQPADENPVLGGRVAPAILLTLVGAAAFFGFFPHLAVRAVGLLPLIPYSFPAADVAHLPEVSFFGSHAMKAGIKSIILGVTFYVLYHFLLCRITIPRWFSLELMLLRTVQGASTLTQPGHGPEGIEEYAERTPVEEGERRPGPLHAITGPGMAERLTGFFNRGQAHETRSSGMAQRLTGFLDREDREQEDREQESGAAGEGRRPSRDMAERLSDWLEPRERKELQEEVEAEAEAEERKPESPAPRAPGGIPLSGRHASRPRPQSPRRLGIPGIDWEALSYRLDVIILKLKAKKEKWQTALGNLPLPDTSSVNTRNLNFAALMLAFLSTLTLIYLVSRTR